MFYQYPQVQGGYRWNLLQRILNTIGIEPISVSDAQVDGVFYTFLAFSRELTAQEKVQVDAIMADNPTFPPSGTVRVKIKDLWEKLADFRASSGLNVKLYFSESVPGSGVIDTLELHTDSPLTTQQKNKVQTAYNNLLTIL